MPAFVLVHGSGAGGWAWDLVRPALEAEGHVVHTPSLPGMTDARTTLADHVDALVETISALERIQLVGHSYGGMPITGAAERVPERIARLVYLDAFVPEDGQSAFDTRPDLEAALRPRAVDGLLPPLDPSFLGVDTEAHAERLRTRMTTTPVRLCADRLALRNPEAKRIPRSYISCTRSGFAATAARARAAGWDFHELQAGHMAMETVPTAVAGLLLEIAGR